MTKMTRRQDVVEHSVSCPVCNKRAMRQLYSRAFVDECGWCGYYAESRYEDWAGYQETIDGKEVVDRRADGVNLYQLTSDGAVWWSYPENTDQLVILDFVTLDTFDVRLDEYEEEMRVLFAEAKQEFGWR